MNGRASRGAVGLARGLERVERQADGAVADGVNVNLKAFAVERGGEAVERLGLEPGLAGVVRAARGRAASSAAVSDSMTPSAKILAAVARRRPRV